MKLKQTNASAHLVQYRFKIREGSPVMNKNDYGGKYSGTKPFISLITLQQCIPVADKNSISKHALLGGNRS